MGEIHGTARGRALSARGGPRTRAKRKDRTLGQAEAQYGLVHRWATYNVEVDTSVQTPEEAVARIMTALDKAGH